MKRSVFIGILQLLFVFSAFSQINSVGHRTITFNDPTRTGGYGSGGGAGRQIQTEIYYPSSAATDGDSTALVPGQYPILIFGHGFVMAWSSYDNIWKDLVPQGYIICFPRTEGGTSPSHTDFGKDLALIQSKMMFVNTFSTSPFYNSMTNKVAIMGHSMGGGSSFLACAGNTAPTTMVTFAAANTNPSSIVAAQQVTIPTLVIAGQNDCVAPPAAHQDSMYLKCASACKAEITIKGASHCEFANPNVACSFGQGTCSPQPTISAATQKSIASIYYSYWLKYWLKNDCQSWNSFLDSANNSTRIIKQLNCGQTCTITGISHSISQGGIEVSPNPTSDLLLIKSGNIQMVSVEVYDALGRKVYFSEIQNTNEIKLDFTEKDPGVYFGVIKSEDATNRTVKFIKN
ncbi:MAG: poly(ethylene terephthalate) hydrolase family protein [Bacteroidia bacterium]